MLSESFRVLWQSHFSDSPPLPYLLRQLYPTRWVRIHSLPDSKRYAESAEDWQILLERQRKVLTDIVGCSGKPYIITGYYPDDSLRNTPAAAVQGTVLASVDFMPLSPVKLATYEDDAPTYCPLLAEVSLQEPFLEELLRAIAEDSCHAFFLDKQQGALVAPYDGGVDIILPTSSLRDQYRNRYGAWLSARADGL